MESKRAQAYTHASNHGSAPVQLRSSHNCVSLCMLRHSVAVLFWDVGRCCWVLFCAVVLWGLGAIMGCGVAVSCDVALWDVRL